jgi:plastocyanin
MRGRVGSATGAIVIAALALAGCGDDSTEAASEGGIDVSLSEWTVEAPATVAAGSVTINAINEGGETHELVVVRADSPDGWETDDTGKVLEDQFAEEDFIGEIEEFEAGTTESATFDLSAGTYVLFCNIVEEEADGTWESHFGEGMVTTIAVE